MRFLKGLTETPSLKAWSILGRLFPLVAAREEKLFFRKLVFGLGIIKCFYCYYVIDSFRCRSGKLLALGSRALYL